ncbi:MAG: hypothetical protein QOJ25_2376, partial [Solirubrobacteraceae bacterium]|nr:hypothetical protein [Solirubrobacteraceae bacterium]
MTADQDDEPNGSRGGSRCATCRAPLADDQRYCVECGERRGGLPLAIAERLRAILARGDAQALFARDPAAFAADPALAGAAAASWRSMPSPRASAVAIMAMLAFGVVIGSLASSSAETQTGPIILAIAPHPAAPAPPAAAPVTPAPSTSASPSTPAAAAPASPASSAGSSSTPTSTGSGTATQPTPSVLPPVKHIFLIMLSDQRY